MTHPLDDRRPLGTEWLVAIMGALLLALCLLVALGSLSPALVVELLGAVLAALFLRVVEAKA
ncbi:hypothetical protein [Streptomyces sp. MNP-20]|uniref:hypothetical protein n=1 Tax=Streptomyces sp. MNP-20 TaxID=2721165 RepID=UPI00155825D6|nr:hypothetical protein [Streptomyces sp. MNP-20]